MSNQDEKSEKDKKLESIQKAMGIFINSAEDKPISFDIKSEELIKPKDIDFHPKEASKEPEKIDETIIETEVIENEDILVPEKRI